jgi:hypothetical protein
VPPDIERANWCAAFNQCYLCDQKMIKEPVWYEFMLNNGIDIHTKICKECNEKEKR